MSTKRRSNVVAKALLVTALASGIAGMQALPAEASSINNIKISYGSTPFLDSDGYIDADSGYAYHPQDYISDVSSIDFTKQFSIKVDTNTYLYYTPNTKIYNSSFNSSYNHPFTFEGGTLYRVSYAPGGGDTESHYDSSFAVTKLGDAKSILGSGSSSGLSEEQKTMIKDLIANWPGLCRLVEKFNERNDDNDEYEKT